MDLRRLQRSACAESSRLSEACFRLRRFSGEEQLPCNCGAPNCRRYVNMPKASADNDSMLVLRSRLKPYRAAAAPTAV